MATCLCGADADRREAHKLCPWPCYGPASVGELSGWYDGHQRLLAEEGSCEFCPHDGGGCGVCRGLARHDGRAAGLGYAEAAEVRRGSLVVYSGTVWVVTAVSRTGRDAPYYRFAGHAGSQLGNWYSWQLCGSARVPPPSVSEVCARVYGSLPK